MDRYDILDKLEGRYIQTIDGNWHQVRNCRHSTEYGIKTNLLYQDIGVLEQYLENSKSEKEMNDGKIK